MVYWLFKAILSPVLRALYRIRVEGREHLPKRGPVILAANHRSFLDSFFIPLVIRRRVTFVAKAEYFDSWRTAWLFRATGQIPLRRGNGTAARQALGEADRVLGGGGVIGIFPEGARSRDGRLQRGNTGPARLAHATGAPLVPVGLVGTDSVQPPGAPLPRPFRPVSVRFGPPIFVATVDGHVKATLRDATRTLMHAIAGLSGQAYVEGADAMASV